jgi:probable HAF family extracellular repeat protein
MEGTGHMTLKSAFASSVVLFCCISFLELPACADALYRVTPLDDMSSNSYALFSGMNNLGQVIGYSPPGAIEPQGFGFVYDGSPGSKGAVTPLGGSSAPSNDPAVRNSTPSGINDNGVVVGTGSTYPPSANGLPPNYYAYANGQTTAIPTVPVAINNGGLVLTTMQGGNPASSQSAIYNIASGATTILPSLPNATQSVPVAINNSGQVVGNSPISSASPVGGPEWHAFLVSSGKVADLGALGGANSYAMAINDSGHVVGGSLVANNPFLHAFLYANGKMTDLGTLPGYSNTVATSINAADQIVGNAYTSPGMAGSAFLSINGVMSNLNSLIDLSSGWTITRAESINNLGQILAVATSTATGNEDRNVLLTPTYLPAPGDPQYVPEPSSLGVFSVMIGGLALRFRPRRKSRTRSPEAR